MNITNMRQIMPFIEGKPEFVVLDKGEYTVVDYVYQDENTFDHPELLECRGIKFDKNGLILARPFRKFFNYGERGADLPAHRPHTITVKLDGSMIHPVMLERRLFFMTRKGHTDVAKQAERYVLSNPARGYQHFCKTMLQDGWTPIFEYVGPNNRIVLRYSEEELCLLALRHTISGQIYPYAALMELAGEHNIPVVPRYDFNLTGQVQKFVEHTRSLENAEGYVVYFDDGYMVKIKAEDYVLKHRALDDLSSKKKVVALCCQGFMDDVLPILSEADADELKGFNSLLQHEVNQLALLAHEIAGTIKSGRWTRKQFALEWAPKIKPKWLAGVVFGVLDGKDARMLVLKAVERGGYENIGVQWRGE